MVIGYQVAETLEAIESIRALEMALATLDQPAEGLIHHSDRGLQYCSGGYVKLLQDRDILISMTESGDPLENAIAERVNGIVKEEYLECYEVENISQAKALLDEVVKLYNEQRPHMSIGYMTPAELHQNNQQTNRLWKPKSYTCKPKTGLSKTVNPLQD